MKLGDYAEPLAYETAFFLQGLANRDFPLEELGGLALDLAKKFRTLAIIVLLTKGDPDLFYHNLIRSGRSWLAYLSRIRETTPVVDHHWCSGRYDPFLDVVAAGDLQLARQIAVLSPAEFRRTHEYEDDYCYAQILYRFVQEIQAPGTVEPFLARWAQFLERQSSERLRVCRALNESKQSSFDEAFAELLDHREMKIESDKARAQSEDPDVIAQRRVFVEGLSLLRLAEVRGLRTEGEYQYCPSLARSAMRKPFPGE